MNQMHVLPKTTEIFSFDLVPSPTRYLFYGFQSIKYLLASGLFANRKCLLMESFSSVNICPHIPPFRKEN